MTNLPMWVQENITFMRMTVYCHSATMLMLGPSTFLQVEENGVGGVKVT